MSGLALGRPKVRPTGRSPEQWNLEARIRTMFHFSGSGFHTRTPSREVPGRSGGSARDLPHRREREPPRQGKRHVAQLLVLSAHFRSNSRLDGLRADQCVARCSLGGRGPHNFGWLSAHIGPNWTNFGPWANFGSNSAKFGPTSAKSGPISAKLRRLRPRVVPCWPRLAHWRQTRPNSNSLGRCRPNCS